MSCVGGEVTSPYGASRRPRVGFPIWEESLGFRRWWVGAFDGDLTKKVRARRLHRRHLDSRPTASGYVGVSGVWIGARKLEGELDVEQRRIVRLVGESMSRCGTSRVQDSVCRSSKFKAQDFGGRGRIDFFNEEGLTDARTGVGWFHCSLT
jgi:hypothetical protein